MADENKTIESGGNVVEDGGVDYIEAIKELKNSTVPKEDYNKLREENQKLLKSLVNGETIEVAAETPVDVNELRKELFSADSDLSNLDYATKAVQLRDAIIAQGGKDPFLPWGKQIAPTQDDIESAEKVAEALKMCIEYAEGDSEIFTNELMRITRDTAPLARRKH